LATTAAATLGAGAIVGAVILIGWQGQWLSWMPHAPALWGGGTHRAGVTVRLPPPVQDVSPSLAIPTPRNVEIPGQPADPPTTDQKLAGQPPGDQPPGDQPPGEQQAGAASAGVRLSPLPEMTVGMRVAKPVPVDRSGPPAADSFGPANTNHTLVAPAGLATIGQAAAAPRPTSAAPISRAPIAVPPPDRAIPDRTIPDRATSNWATQPVPTPTAPGPSPGRAPSVAALPPGAATAAPPATVNVPRQFSGAARATGAVSLTVNNIQVQLFGIRPAEGNDRCGGTAPGSCAGTAAAALAQRLATNPAVSCRVPSSHGGLQVPAICRDALGTDLSNYLVGEGLALADQAQSLDYVSAEAGARAAKRGLWASR